MICATENSVVWFVVKSVSNNFIRISKNRGGYFMTPEETKRVSVVLLSEDMGLNAKAIRKTATTFS